MYIFMFFNFPFSIWARYRFVKCSWTRLGLGLLLPIPVAHNILCEIVCRYNITSCFHVTIWNMEFIIVLTLNAFIAELRRRTNGSYLLCKHQIQFRQFTRLRQSSGDKLSQITNKYLAIFRSCRTQTNFFPVRSKSPLLEQTVPDPALHRPTPISCLINWAHGYL